MRKIDKIIVHCTATPEGREVTIEEIDSWHKARGWSQVGYHYLVSLDGKISKGRDIEIQGAHCKGENKSSIGVAYSGGCDKDMNAKDTRTEKQKQSLEYLIGYLSAMFPGSKIFGHRDFSTKECPSFDAKSEYKFIEDKYV
tara:strand:+ start:536 stop:958 length:423 start_codon:yes stop_codon:yes gene_type:complete